MEFFNLLLATNQLFEAKMQFGDFVLFALSLIVFFAWIFSIVYILWGGVLLILSWGNEEKTKPAINTIRYALVWLIVVVVSIFVFPKAAGLLWLDANKYSSPDRIFQEIKRIWDKVLGNGSNDLNLDGNGLDDDFLNLDGF